MVLPLLAVGLLCTMASAEASGYKDWDHSKKYPQWTHPSKDWLNPWNYESFYSRPSYPYGFYPGSYYYDYYYPSSRYYNWYCYPYNCQYPYCQYPCYYSYPAGYFSEFRYSLVVG